MNLSNLDKALNLRSQLKKVRDQLQAVRVGGISISGYSTSLHVSNETSSSVRTLVVADLEKQEKALVAELSKLGVTEGEDQAASAPKLSDPLNDAIISSLILGPLMARKGSVNGFRG
ncbi:hypothetical protein [Mesorhizobium sp.]|uniref:hypothetical protein n=1 Tax=Mesorhizobium sp. TaxID=1871066 RepID=UPI000FE3248C|nr:hypothetical protein [Mesorhizobium sp.]RWJ03449.1 MAG: hypothetical protein EOR24_32220 [Mesorhizobium sp.]